MRSRMPEGNQYQQYCTVESGISEGFVFFGGEIIRFWKNKGQSERFGCLLKTNSKERVMVTQPERIISRFNMGIGELEISNELAKKGNINEQQERLHNAACAVYESLEWTVLNQKQDWIRNQGGKANYEKERSRQKKQNFHFLFELIEQAYTGNIINFSILRDYKKPVRNIPVHEGGIPYYASLLEVFKNVREFILLYYKDADLKNIPISDSISASELSDEGSKYEEFFDACCYFEKGMTYILIIGDCSEISDIQLNILSQLPWSLIIDLDPKTDLSGFYKAVYKDLSKFKSIHLFTCDDQQQTFSPYSSIYWFAAKGLVGRHNTVFSNSKDWLRQNLYKILLLIEKFEKTFEAPVRTIIMDDSVEYIEELCKNIDFKYTETNQFIYALPDNNKILPIIDRYDGKFISITKSAIIAGIRIFSQSLNVSLKENNHIILPAKDCEEIELPIEDYRKTEEYFEVVHKNILNEKQVQQEREEFLKGKEITWYGIEQHFDVDRTITKNIIRQCENDFRKRENTIIYLNYSPGMGGTTIGKRIAWNYYQQYPTLIIKKYDSKITADRVYEIYALTKKPVFIVIESAVISPFDIRNLLNDVASRNFPTVFLVLQRTDLEKPSPSPIINEFLISPFLDDDECRKFINYYKELSKSKIKELDNILIGKIKYQKNPFYIGLTAFENDFLGLEDYIEKRLLGVRQTQKKIAAFLSLAYYYGQQSLSAQFFADLLNLPQNITVKLEDFLPHSLKKILINDDSLGWRPIHYLVAKELIEQILASNNPDKKIWKQNLSDYAIKFIELSAKIKNVPTDKHRKLLKRLFIERDNQDVTYQDKFSPLIEDVLKEGRLPIFNALKDYYPDESHFWAHLARYYSKVEKNIEEALYHIDKAIALSLSSDPLLYHMKGMCLISKIDSLMEDYQSSYSKDHMKQLKDLINQCEDLFTKSREINKYQEYGYISHINLYINVIEFGFNISGSKTSYEKADFFKKIIIIGIENYWIKQSLYLKIFNV